MRRPICRRGPLARTSWRPCGRSRSGSRRPLSSQRYRVVARHRSTKARVSVCTLGQCTDPVRQFRSLRLSQRLSTKSQPAQARRSVAGSRIDPAPAIQESAPNEAVASGCRRMAYPPCRRARELAIAKGVPRRRTGRSLRCGEPRRRHLKMAANARRLADPADQVVGTSDVALLVVWWRGGRRPRSRLGGSRRSRC